MPETTDNPKKTKAPAKPRATAATKDGVAKAPTTRKASPKKAADATSAPAPRVPTHEEIARLAQQYWAERGHTDGHAEQDWLRAERELMKRAS